MKTSRKSAPRRTAKLSSAFDRQLSTHLLGLRREVERPNGRARPSRNLTALQETTARLSAAMTDLSSRRVGDLRERIEELDYPFAKLAEHFAGKRTGLEHRAVEILAEYLRDRLLEMRIVAKELDARRR